LASLSRIEQPQSGIIAGAVLSDNFRQNGGAFEASFFGGFMLSGEGRERGELYKELGHHIGMIFQLTDDCADYELNYEQRKKPVKSDFEQE
jgi:geranylgeranyl pyrophosphate synthase